MNEEVVRMRAVVTGRVQGVGFRYYAERTARSFRVRGFVRNLDDGSVEVEAEGPQDEVEAFLEKVRIGPPGSRVLGMDARSVPPIRAENGFRIGY